MKHRGKHETQRKHRSRLAVSATVALVLLFATAGTTLAYLIAKTGSVENAFTPSRVACAVTEQFDGTVKRDVNVQNTGDVDAYVRVKLLTYRVNDAGERIGGATAVPMFTPGAGWFAQDGYYYYAQPVAPGAQAAADLIGEAGVALQAYTDADGGKQVLEVLAEAIQALPAQAVADAWGVSVAGGALTQGA